MKIDFHLHTRASFDCQSDPAKIFQWAVQKGLNGLCVTEHDTTAGFTDLKMEAHKYGLFVIPGLEFTAARGTHYLVYLTPELPLPFDDIQMIDEVHRRGGLVGIPHPFRSDTGLVYNQIELKLYVESEIKSILSKADFIEICNAKSSSKQNAQAAILGGNYPNLKWLAGSDSHHPSTVGAAHTEIPGFEFGTIQEIAQQLKTLPTKIVILEELTESATARNIRTAIEGGRRLMVNFKPAVPKVIWNSGKAMYRSVNNRLTEKRASKSIVK